ncbi:MAG TPA: septum formation initiator family protein [Actinomycetota bacterium]|jgi:cell division protein FtsB|nr:septum formation initiator family protein [Actinomycetota bacterium]
MKVASKRRPTPKQPRPRLERDRPRLTGRAAALLVAVSVLIVMAVVPARQLLEQRGRIAELDRLAAELQSQNGELRGEISALHDPVHLEELARACLGMVAPGEVAFLIAGKPPADC